MKCEPFIDAGWTSNRFVRGLVCLVDTRRGMLTGAVGADNRLRPDHTLPQAALIVADGRGDHQPTR